MRLGLRLYAPSDGVQVGAEAIVKVGVWLPNLLQHPDIQRELQGHRHGVDVSNCHILLLPNPPVLKAEA